MSEFMGLIQGKYDAKVGFVEGGASLHSCMTAHGPDKNTFVAASTAELKPEHFEAGLAFMFETTYMLKVSDFAAKGDHREKDYIKCWGDMPKMFDPTNPAARYTDAKKGSKRRDHCRE
jgi:homogentisate 1,2-dioxygenase